MTLLSKRPGGPGPKPARRRGRLWVAMLGVVTALVVILGFAPFADAAPGYTISSGTWNVRSCPATCQPVDTIATGGIPDLLCQVSGPPVTVVGFGTSTIYDMIRTPRGLLGYVSDLAVSQTLYARYSSWLPLCDAATTYNNSVAPTASRTGYSWIGSCAYQVSQGKVWACWVYGAAWLFAPSNAS